MKCFTKVATDKPIQSAQPSKRGRELCTRFRLSDELIAHKSMARNGIFDVRDGASRLGKGHGNAAREQLP